jgi:hypothetical protein
MPLGASVKASGNALDRDAGSSVPDQSGRGPDRGRTSLAFDAGQFPQDEVGVSSTIVCVLSTRSYTET